MSDNYKNAMGKESVCENIFHKAVEGYKKAAKAFSINRITKEMIIEVSKFNPLVNQVLEFNRMGFISWEQAMMYCVFWLGFQLKEAQDELIRMKEREAPPII